MKIKTKKTPKKVNLMGGKREKGKVLVLVNNYIACDVVKKRTLVRNYYTFFAE